MRMELENVCIRSSTFCERFENVEVDRRIIIISNVSEALGDWEISLQAENYLIHSFDNKEQIPDK